MLLLQLFILRPSSIPRLSSAVKLKYNNYEYFDNANVFSVEEKPAAAVKVSGAHVAPGKFLSRVFLRVQLSACRLIDLNFQHYNIVFLLSHDRCSGELRLSRLSVLAIRRCLRRPVRRIRPGLVNSRWQLTGNAIPAIHTRSTPNVLPSFIVHELF